MQRFESMFTQALSEIARVLKSDGIAVIVFAHKTTDAWETILNALLSAGLYLTASWPLHTEMKSRLRAQESAALASSIYMVCRKRTVQDTAYFSEIKDEIILRVQKKLEQFWNEGISGADFFISAIGAGSRGIWPLYLCGKAFRRTSFSARVTGICPQNRKRICTFPYYAKP
jgi:adenine-specific DNA methylase